MSEDENKLIAERREKLRALRAKGIAFPNDFKVDDFAGDLQSEYEDAERWNADAIAGANRRVRVAGRVMAKRGQGKVAFIPIRDFTGEIQIFAQANALGDAYEIIKSLGSRRHRRRGRHDDAHEDRRAFGQGRCARLITKSLRPLPDKWHGLADVEQRYRQRYVDLIVTPESRRVFALRSRDDRASCGNGSKPSRGVSWKSKRR